MAKLGGPRDRAAANRLMHVQGVVESRKKDYGIGPWQRHRLNATAMVGRVMWELIEPLDDKSIFGRFLAEKGEGVHHNRLSSH